MRKIDIQIESEDIVELAIRDKSNDEMGSILIDTSDPENPIRWANMIKMLTSIQKESLEGEKELKEKYKDVLDDEFNYDRTVDFARFRINMLNKIKAQFDEMFGEGTIDSLFARNMALNPDYIPDEAALSDLIDGISPVMEQLFNTRFERCKAKYNVQRRGKGKHSLTKEELIQRQMGK